MKYLCNNFLFFSIIVGKKYPTNIFIFSKLLSFDILFNSWIEYSGKKCKKLETPWRLTDILYGEIAITIDFNF